MLVALNDQTQVVHSYEASKNARYYCPCCKNEVILKKGEIKLPHFAHKSLDTCVTFSESESLEHLNGKLMIIKNCEKYGLEYELEAYLPDINQRADVLINNKVAIEFQCSSLSIERLKERTYHYQTSGYQVFWIMGSHVGTSQKLTELKKHMTYFDNERGYISFCLLTESNHLVVTHYLSGGVEGLKVKKIEYSMDEMSLLEVLFFSKPAMEWCITHPFDEMQKRKRLFNRKIMTKDSHIEVMQAYLYQHHAHLLYLPTHVYFPNIYHPFLKGEDVLIRFVIYNTLKEEKQLYYHDLRQKVIEKLPSKCLEKYANLTEYQVVDYCLSIYSCFLQQLGMIQIVDTGEIKFKEEKRISEIEWEKIFKKRSERLTLPLKYDMIIK